MLLVWWWVERRRRIAASRFGSPPNAVAETAGHRVRSRRRWTLPRTLAAIVGLCVLSGVAVWAIYGFSVGGVRLDDPTVDTGYVAPGLAMHALPDWIVILLRTSIVPAPAFVNGLVFQDMHNAVGHGAYFMGQASMHGWWYYFPIVFLAKTTLPVLALLALGLLLAAVPPGRLRADECFVWLPAVLFFASVLTSHIDIGVRYLLPVTGLSFVWIGRVPAALGGLAATAPRVGRWAWRGTLALLLALVLWQAREVAMVAPDYLAYFNEVVGGPGGGWRVAADSNLDLGQDTPQLAAYLRQHPIPGRTSSFTP